MPAATVARKELSSEDIASALDQLIDQERIFTRPIDRIAWASDASFYRLIPKAVVHAKSLAEIRGLFSFVTSTKSQ